jgi:homoserine dehydrogenase
MDIARNMQYNCKGRIHCSCYKEIPIKAIDECRSSYFIRMQAMNRPGVLAAISGVFGENNVSIAQFIQKNAMDEEAEMVLITENVLEKDFRKAVDALREMPILKEISAIIRVYSA